MNDGSFVLAIPLDDPPIELMLDPELAERPPLELRDALEAVVLEPLPYVEDEEFTPLPEPLP